LKVALDLKNVKYKKVLVDDVTGTVHVTDEQVKINDLLAHVQDGEVQVNAIFDVPAADSGDDGGLTMSAIVKKMAIQPFAESFASAKFAKQVQGVVRNAELELSSSTLQPQALLTALTAGLSAEFDVLSIQQVEWLDELANGLNIDELRALVFNAGGIEAGIDGGVINLRKLLLSGAQARIDSSGRARIGDEINADIQLAFAGRLLEKIGRGELGQQMVAVPDTDYKRLPAKLKVEGPLAAPEVKVANFLKNLVLNTGREALREKIREKTNLGDGEIEAGLQVLQGLLGDGSASDTDSQNNSGEESKPKSKAKSNQSMNLLRGLIDDAIK